MTFHEKLRWRNRALKLMPWAGELSSRIELLREYSAWRRRGVQYPLPGVIKRCLIKTEALRIGAKMLVETGTWLGDTPWCFRNEFREIHSIEVEARLARIAAARFQSHPHIHIHFGDSAKVLRELGPRISETALFWLDGHYSGGVTGKGETECPIWMEIECIFETVKPPFSIMIDDARHFGTNPDYPTVPLLRQELLKRRPEYSFKIENDIIFFYPQIGIPESTI